MKKVWVVLALLLMLSVIPVMAETTTQEPITLQAMSKLSSVIPMTDQHLASVEGDGFFFILKLNYVSIQRLMFHAHCGGFAALHCNHTDGVSHPQGDVAHRQGERPHQKEVSRPQGDVASHQKEVSHSQGNRPHPRVEVSVSCTARDCSRHPGVDGVVDTHGAIRIEQKEREGGNTSSIFIVQQSNGGRNTATVRQQSNGGRNTATVKQSNRAAPR